MTRNLQELGDYIAQTVADRVLDHYLQNGELVVITEPKNIVPLLTFLREDESCRFTQLTDLCGVDYPTRAKRFELVYNLLSIHKNCRLRIKLSVDEATPVPSIVDVHPAANWFEREVWDMYGVQFSGHPDLRRILTDYGFEGHPQRRDFPLTGYVELRYSEDQKRVVYEKVDLNQAYRSFDFESPWEGPHYPAPAVPPVAAPVPPAPVPPSPVPPSPERAQAPAAEKKTA
jgi:NADH-quinone oxidoreductase subunit C